MYAGSMFCDVCPSVSVIMGTLYRRADVSCLKRSVESILNQTLSQFEFVICDTGSSNEAVAYLENIADSRVKLVRRSGCLDLASKLNLCLGVAKGQYIARMDDDDWSYPDRLEKQIQFLQENSEISFVGCNVSLVQNGIKAGQRVFPEYPAVEDFYFSQPYIHPTLVFHREALKAVDGYSESKDRLLCEDYDLLLRLYKAGYRGSNLQEILLDYTISATAKGNRKMRHRINEVKTRFARFKELGLLPMALPYILKPIAVGVIPEKMLGRLKKEYSRRV